MLDLDYSKLFMAIFYITHVLAIYGLISILQNIFKRQGPVRPNYENPEIRNKRTFEMSTNKSNNNSFPNLDAA